MKITSSNYFSNEVRSRYMSVSTFKNLTGVPAKKKCQFMEISKLKGDFKTEPTRSMLVGSYVDSHFEKTLDNFKENNPNIFTLKGDLRSEFKHANTMIAKAESSKPFMKMMDGETQFILRGELFGREWIGKVDIMHDNMIVDLKTCADINDVWCGYEFGFVNFMDGWGYTLQGAVYQELERQRSGKLKEFFLTVITKEKIPRIEIIHIPNEVLKKSLENAELIANDVFDVFDGKTEPTKCDSCDCCNSSHVITEILSYYDFLKY